MRTAVQKSTIPTPRQSPGHPDVDDEVRRIYEEKYGEGVPTPEEWRTRRLMPINEARQQLGGISPPTFYGLMKANWC